MADEEVREKSDELEGILWWSFYEEPFEGFIEHLYHYLTSGEAKAGSGVFPGDVFTRIYPILCNNRFLLILDGFERALRGYAGMSAMYIQEEGLSHEGAAQAAAEWERRQREPVHPQAARFLRRLTACKTTRTLMTTRLFPAPLEGVSGVRHHLLKGLSRGDAVRFLRAEGIHGSRPELEQAGEIYHFHPLMLKLLSTAIKKTQAKDIKAAFSLSLIDRKEPQKILATSYNLLSAEEKGVATHVSVFRTGFGLETACALFPEMDGKRLWGILRGLEQLGFLFYDEKEKLFDLHPILRSFLYASLTERKAVHQQAAEYFKALPKAERVVSIEDLAPVIEHYHHLVGAGRFDEALDLFRDRLSAPIYYQLPQYHLRIELLKELFPDGEDKPPHLKEPGNRAWTLTALANSYSKSGQSARALPLFLKATEIDEDENDKGNVAIELGNAATDQIMIGRLSAAAAHIQKEILICQEIRDEFHEAIGHQELGRVLAYQGKAGIHKALNPGTVSGRTSEDALARASEFYERTDDYQGLSIVSAYRSLACLMQARLARVVPEMSGDLTPLVQGAILQARKALGFAEKDMETGNPVPRDFIRAYRLLADALIMASTSARPFHLDPFEIHLYDDNLQKQVDSLPVKKGRELEAAERCLNEALCRCRKANLVELEPDILLASARLEWARLPLEKQCIENLACLEETLKEASEISERAGYRLSLADIHLFCAEVLLPAPETLLLGLSARGHLQRAREYALDMSEFPHLFRSRDPHFYDGIPEYGMLKRGMTGEERIENGYLMAYRTADALEKGLKAA